MIVRSMCFAVMLVAFVAGSAAAQSQKPVTFGTNPPGTVFHAIASGLAKVVGEAGAVKPSIQPYAGSSTFLPLLNTGEIEFGVNNAVDMALAWRGPAFNVGGKNPFPHTPNARLLTRGSPFIVALFVKKDSGFNHVRDLKGRRVAGEYRAHLAIWYNMFGHLATGGLTWDDVKVVPVATINDGVDAVVQGRADAASYSLNSAKVREADAQVGLKHITNDCTQEGEKRLRQAVPGYYPVRLKKGDALGILDDMCAIAYDVYITVGKGVPDDVAETTLRAIWDGTEKLKPIHPVFKEWTRERMPTHEITMPYHPGAVRFLKEKKVWTPEMDKAQQQQLSMNPGQK